MPRIISRFREVIAVLTYGLSASTALVMGFAIYDRTLTVSDLWQRAALPLAALVALRLLSHRVYRLTTSRWRYVGTADVLRLVGSTTVGTVLFFVCSESGVLGPEVPLPVIGLEWVLSIFLTAAVWIAYRVLFEHFRARGDAPGTAPRRVLIIGAGEAGNLLAREILRSPTGLEVVGFVDDDPLKRGTYVQGIRVMGAVDDLGALTRDLEIGRLIIAIPSAEPSDFRRIVDACEASAVEYRVLPGMTIALEGEVSVRQLRRVTIEDLLGRAPVEVELPALSRELRDAVVLVTGAGGSIGSELARQIAANGPKALLLLDQAESDLFFAEMEIRERFPTLSVEAVVADICEAEHMSQIVGAAGVTHLFHAAAYKHVPLMEANVCEAVRNNVLGTRVLLDVACAARIASFALVSTDKAVQPANVMGATKRLCELMLLDAAERCRGTDFTAVRFGNVLGSNGSVVQVFRRQLETGRLTVTDAGITRYFMTVGEAVQLILLATILPEARGRIVMLEMGEPVRILDLARNMIRLSGLVEGRDVRVEFTGLRPGEKLHEELVSPFETTSRTQNGKIHLVSTRRAGPELRERCDRLIHLAREGRDEEARILLDCLVASPELEMSRSNGADRKGAEALGRDGRGAGLAPAAGTPETERAGATLGP